MTQQPRGTVFASVDTMAAAAVSGNAAPFFLDDAEGDDEARRPIEQQLQRELVFVQEHEATLRGIESAITDATAQVPREDHSIPIRFHFHPTERVPALELVNTGEKFLRKVLAVFAYLCDEIHELLEVAEGHFFPRLVMFGATLAGSDDDDEGTGGGGKGRRSADPLRGPGRSELAIGRLLPFLQELSNFVDRCYACVMSWNGMECHHIRSSQTSPTAATRVRGEHAAPARGALQPMPWHDTTSHNMTWHDMPFHLVLCRCVVNRVHPLAALLNP